MEATWPVMLTQGPVRLRPIVRADRNAWFELRQRNVEWLRRWDATLPMPDRTVPANFAGMVRFLRREARAGRSLSFGLEFEGRLIGQITLGGISWGSLRSGYIGYWIDERYAGRGITPLAVAMVCDHAFNDLHLHRLEINLRTENTASRRVVEKLGFRYEALREKYLHIAGDWRDHLCFVLFSEELSNGVVESLQRKDERVARLSTAPMVSQRTVTQTRTNRTNST